MMHARILLADIYISAVYNENNLYTATAVGHEHAQNICAAQNIKKKKNEGRERKKK